jgi:hypothetical protein
MVEVILAVTRLVTHFAEIVELGPNPIRVMGTGGGAQALDARMTLGE